MHSKAIAFVGTVLLLWNSGPVTAGLSREDFSNPPMAARPSALWTWLNGYVDRKQITRELEEMKAKGMRGAIIWDLGAIIDPGKIVPGGPEFLGPESLASIHHAMDEAGRLGLELGLVASSSWNAGGTWITPKDGSKVLLWSELKVRGPVDFSGMLPLPEKITDNHRDVAVMAVPDRPDKSIAAAGGSIRLDSHFSEGGRLEWSVPEGDWKILRFVCNNTGEFLNCPSPNSRGLVIDHLNPQATDAHINHMLGRLREGRDGFGPLKTLMFDSYEVRSGTDWTPDFIKEFIARNDYDPSPWLPVLAGWTIGDEDLSQRFLHDYRKMVSDLIIEQHFARSRQLLNRHGLQLLSEGGHGGHARVDPLKALGAADIPMGEFWNHRKNWVTKEAASAAHIYGKQIVNAESFTGWQHWQDGPAAYKRLFDIALCAGLNQVTFHTFSHNPPEAGLPGFAYHAGEHFNVNSTWWDHAGPMLDYFSRSCHLLQQGGFVADVCAYYGDDAPNLVPARRIAPSIKSQWDDDHCAHCGKPKPVDLDSLGQGYDYDYINEEVLLTRMSVRDGVLMLPDGMSYRLMVLPDRKAISPAALMRIGELVKAGATIVGPKPERSNSLRNHPDCDDEVRELAATIWGDCDGDQVKVHAYGKGRVIWNMPLGGILDEMGVKPDFKVTNTGNEDLHIDYIHRRTDDEDIYFVSNSSLARKVVECRFRTGAGNVPTFWNPENGSVTPCHLYREESGFTSLVLDLPPAASVFVVFTKGDAPDHVVGVERFGKPGERGIKAASPEIEILAMKGGQVEAKVWKAGEYEIKSAGGRVGRLSIPDVPGDRFIEGPWRVTFPAGYGAPPEIIMKDLSDWKDHADTGVRFFSGSATYHNRFSLPESIAKGRNPVMLDLGEVREVATVRVNGKEAGVLWKEPYVVDVSHHLQTGVNSIEIRVANTWNNRLVGDAGRDSATRITRTNLANKFNPKSALLSSGLLGPVRLRMLVLAACRMNGPETARDE